jgi:ubiquinone/menaquinone biosynthesis C-methylase UbiE
MRNYLASQFGNPRGPIGSLVGHVMAMKNRQRVDLIIDQFDVKPGDAILEIGFGPGLGFKRLLDENADIQMEGLEASVEMVRQATRRNRSAISAGQLALHLGNACEMKFSDDSFDVVYTVNTLHHVPSLEAFIREMARVTKSGGCIVVGHQHPYKWPDAPVPGRMEKAESMLQGLGFQTVAIDKKEMSPSPTYFLKAIRNGQ